MDLLTCVGMPVCVVYVDRIMATSYLDMLWWCAISSHFVKSSFQWNFGCRAGLCLLLMPHCLSDSGAFVEIKSCACVSLWFCCFLNFSFLGRVLFQLLMNGFAVFWGLDWRICGACFSVFQSLVSALDRWPTVALLWPFVSLCPTGSLLTTSTLRPLSNPAWWSLMYNLLLLRQQLLLQLPRTLIIPVRRMLSILRLLPLPPPPQLPMSSIPMQPHRHQQATWLQQGMDMLSSSRLPLLPPQELLLLQQPSASTNLSSCRQIACSKTMKLLYQRKAGVAPLLMKRARWGGESSKNWTMAVTSKFILAVLLPKSLKKNHPKCGDKWGISCHYFTQARSRAFCHYWKYTNI